MEGEVFYENFCCYKVILYLVNADVYTKPFIERTMALKEPGRLALSLRSRREAATTELSERRNLRLY